MSKDEWSDDVERNYHAARSKAGLAYGPWQVVEVENAIVTYNAQPGCFKRVDRGYAVADVAGNVFATVESKELAELIASVPDLCDTALRPRGSFSGPLTVTYKDATFESPKLLGVSDPARVFEYGVANGYQVGFDLGYDEGTDTVVLDVEGDNGQ